MAEKTNMEEVIAQEGRFTARPRCSWPQTSVLLIDFDILGQRLECLLNDSLSYLEPLRRYFDGTMEQVNEKIMDGIQALVTQALFELWNRLRVIASTHHIATYHNIFRKKAPTSTGLQFPSFVASMLSGIDPIRIDDGLMQTTIIYAPSQATCNNYGRKRTPFVNASSFLSFMYALKGASIPMSEITRHGSVGSFFTTCETVETDPGFYEVIGCFSSKHYSRADAVMALAFGPFGSNLNPFQDPSLRVGFIDDEATIKAFRQIPVVDGEPGPDSQAHPVWGTFGINHFGIAPVSNVPVPFRGQGIYVLGRGKDKLCHCSLARSISQYERLNIFLDRLLFTPTRLNVTQFTLKRPAT